MTTDYLYIGYINHFFAKKNQKKSTILVLKVDNIIIYQLLYRAKNPTLLKNNRIYIFAKNTCFSFTKTFRDL